MLYEVITLYRWSVAVCDDSGESAEAEATFETGHMDEPWLARWICAQTKFDDDAKESTYS